MLRNNPVMNSSTGVPVRLAVNTAQYGRTFEDRSWTFNIIRRPEELEDKTIHNLNVQGKRGNIAQVRNCIEYDFVPNNLTIVEGEYIHFQWVGSDFNPAGNAGEGRDGTDRSNLVEVADFKSNLPISNGNELSVESEQDSLSNNNGFFTNEEVGYILASLRQEIDNPDQCFTWRQLYDGRRNEENNINNCALLNRAEPYFNIFPVKTNRTGRFYMISSRNNNFSNRGQKVIIRVKRAPVIPADDSNTDDNSALSRVGGKGDNTTYLAIVVTLIVSIILAGSYAYGKKQGDNYWTHQWNYVCRSCRGRV